MSLQYVNETEAVETSIEEDESVQRAQPIFPLYSVILIASLIAVTVGQIAVDGSASIVFGGNLSASLAGFDKQAFASGEYWRILTGAVLHGGLIHLAFNCYALFILGKLIETLSNRAHLAIVFLLAAIGGNILSLIFLPEGNSVGASGGILGFLGYLTAYGFVRRKLLTDAFLKNMLFNVAFIAFTGIFVLANVDNFAHLGGFVAGAVYGFLQIPRDLHKDPREVGETTKFIGLAALGITVVVSVFSILILLRVI
jgi:membrane associated rhomboid family serine protease